MDSNTIMKDSTAHHPIEDADRETASDDYASRFSGPTGEWMLKLQERATEHLLGGWKALTILDVGGGHGQIALPLLKAGHAVTVLGSCHEALYQLTKSAATPAKLTLATGPLLQLPFKNESFDVVVSFRLLPHCEAWPTLIGELCRVARRAVIVDYPTGQSLNSLTPLLFRMKKNFEKNTRTYRLFRHREVADAFQEHSFAPARRAPQFFFPMVVHRMVSNPGVSQALESPARLFGLTHLFGSPVVARFDRAR
ncbi:MAG: class I SAM-dependent methyltransferase [Bdellovibrionota bacterium]